MKCMHSSYLQRVSVTFKHFIIQLIHQYISFVDIIKYLNALDMLEHF